MGLTLDGEDLEEAAEGSFERGEQSIATPSLPTANEDIKGLSAYWQRGDLQQHVVEQMAQQIRDYSVEADADTEGFGSRVDDAVLRSHARRKGVQKCAETASRSLE